MSLDSLRLVIHTRRPFKSFLLFFSVTSAYNVTVRYMIFATLATEIRNLSCIFFFPLRKSDLNKAKLEQDYISNLMFKDSITMIFVETQKK